MLNLLKYSPRNISKENVHLFYVKILSNFHTLKKMYII